ncbi:MAG: NifU family protein [Gammaproteobacteria bacterium]|nr:NifU family protein [Gammaproteobacteria bacterium]
MEPPPAKHRGAAGSAGDTESLIRATLDERIRPLLLERGGDLLFRGFHDGVVELELAGSPGASRPLRAYIEGMLRHYAHEDIHLRLVAGDAGANSRSRGDQSSLAAQVQSILAEQINPAVAAHDGAVRLTRVEGSTVYLCFQGRCQGCAMAEVTLRQGVEPMLKELAAGVVSVVDTTDHARGTDPYFKTKKGPA